MHSLRKILFFVTAGISLFFLSCSNTSRDKELMVGRYKIWIDVPEQYQQFNIDLINQADKSDFEEEEIILINMLKNLSEKDKNLKVFLDTNNILNYITITIGQYLEINKNTTQQLSELTKSSLIRRFDHLNVQVRIMERAIKSGEHRYMKLKYKLDLHNSCFYQTFYMLSTSYGTFGIAVIHKEGEDFENIIATMKVK